MRFDDRVYELRAHPLMGDDVQWTREESFNGSRYAYPCRPGYPCENTANGGKMMMEQYQPPAVKLQINLTAIWFRVVPSASLFSMKNSLFSMI